VAEDTKVVVRGYKELIQASRLADKATRKEMRATFRKVGDPVRQEAAALFARYDARSAAGYRTYVRQRGISVEQSIRRTTGKHPEFGALQMTRALLPSLEDNRDKTEQAFEDAVDRVCDLWERV
jgi:hypothetical protein